jgi:hypothetical protein
MKLTGSKSMAGGTEADETEASRAARLRMIEDLRELVTALDRRVPHLERTGEIAIARDAAALRKTAVERIACLEDALSRSRTKGDEGY